MKSNNTFGYVIAKQSSDGGHEFVRVGRHDSWSTWTKQLRSAHIYRSEKTALSAIKQSNLAYDNPDIQFMIKPVTIILLEDILNYDFIGGYFKL